MTIASEVTKLNTNLTNAYTAVSDKGGTLPATQNFDNLATAISSIQSGSDLTGLGNQLRKAYAYTYTELSSGKYSIGKISSNTLYESPLYDNIELNDDYSRVVIDGKAYSLGFSNNTITFTQIGTATDWNYCITRSTGIKDNKPYPTSISSETVENYIPTIYRSSLGCSIIINGKHYCLNNAAASTALNADGGVWTASISTGSSSFIGIRDGYLTIIMKQSNVWNTYVYYDYKISSNLYLCPDGYSDHFFVDSSNTIQWLKFNSSSGVFSIYKTGYQLTKTPKKLLGSDMDMGLCIGVIYMDDSFEIISFANKQVCYSEINCKNVIYTSGDGDEVSDFIILKTDGNLYKLTGSYDWDEDIASYSETLLKNIGENGDIQAYTTTGENGLNYFKICYLDDIATKYTLYTPSTITTKGYTSVSTSSSAVTLDSHTSNSITVDEKTYVRDDTRDSTFKFVPSELSTHQFTDQEICQAALIAGL